MLYGIGLLSEMCLIRGFGQTIGVESCREYVLCNVSILDFG